jgi:hypothetical protein
MPCLVGAYNIDSGAIVIPSCWYDLQRSPPRHRSAALRATNVIRACYAEQLCSASDAMMSKRSPAPTSGHHSSSARHMTSTSPRRIRRFGRYELLRQIGQNEVTLIYLAAALDKSRAATLVTVELLRKELTRDRDFRALFLDRAAATLPLRHPNISNARDIIADRRVCGFVREFVAGASFGALRARVELPLWLELRVLCDALAALHYAHRQQSGSARVGLTHGDVSPAQILVTHEGHIKLVGLGVAPVRQVLERRCGAQTGDLGYKAPELFLGDAATAATDVYSIGVLLWEALARRRRCFGGRVGAIALRRTRGAERDIDHVAPNAPKSLRAACRRALEVSPRDRYRTAFQLQVELEAHLRQMGAGDVAAARAELVRMMAQLFAGERDELRLFVGRDVEQRPLASPEPTLDERARPPPALLPARGDSAQRAFSKTRLRLGTQHPSASLWRPAGVIGLAMIAGAATAVWFERAPENEPSSVEFALRLKDERSHSVHDAGLPPRAALTGLPAPPVESRPELPMQASTLHPPSIIQNPPLDGEPPSPTRAPDGITVPAMDGPEGGGRLGPSMFTDETVAGSSGPGAERDRVAELRLLRAAELAEISETGTRLRNRTSSPRRRLARRSAPRPAAPTGLVAPSENHAPLHDDEDAPHAAKR